MLRHTRRTNRFFLHRSTPLLAEALNDPGGKVRGDSTAEAETRCPLCPGRSPRRPGRQPQPSPQKAPPARLVSETQAEHFGRTSLLPRLSPGVVCGNSVPASREAAPEAAGLRSQHDFIGLSPLLLRSGDDLSAVTPVAPMDGAVSCRGSPGSS